MKLQKTLACTLYACLPAVAFAQKSDTSDCPRIAGVYNYAGSYRDQGLSPQETFKKMKGMWPSGQEFVKGAINQVYFDPDLSRWSTSRIVSIVTRECYAPPRVFTPLD